MTCSGLLPIDELRDWRSPGSVVCQRIKRHVLEAQLRSVSFMFCFLV